MRRKGWGKIGSSTDKSIEGTNSNLDMFSAVHNKIKMVEITWISEDYTIRLTEFSLYRHNSDSCC